ncbi:hypothetical protein FRUB_02542 [Fimbriiglobus ruber]|uniref:Big-1 domain-containing protein n=1 Tax=Fimbriiglobus ruber TaxID=1908690 RepID=A0A225DPE5_9BACT|nr:hypothetical protein FRUB_02542 [Fimbriiglobus ruber]
MVWLACLGCGDSQSAKAPKITPVKVTVKINGQPLPQAKVTFVLTSDKVSGSGTASGVTDDSGQATLTIDGKSGACVGGNAVSVMEGEAPPAPGAEKGDRHSRGDSSKKTDNLKNRPIPVQYANAIQSGVKVDVTEGKSEYTIELKR